MSTIFDAVDHIHEVAKSLTELGAYLDVDDRPWLLKQQYTPWRPLIRSAFQKDIRRGFAEHALVWGWYLYRHEPAYARQALTTIIVEDVGMANLDLCTVTHLAGDKAFRNKFGGERALFLGLINEAALSFKNRVPCELSVLLSQEHVLPKIPMPLDPSDDTLIGLMTPHSKFPGTLARYQMYLAGTYLRARCRNGNHDLMTRCLLALQKYYGGDTQKALHAMVSFEKATDTMAHGIHALQPGRTGLHTEVDAFDTPRHESGLPLAALDQHTSLGREVFGELALELTSDFKGLSTNAIAKIVGNALFFAEGAMIDKPSYSVEEAAIRDEQMLAYLGKGSDERAARAMDFICNIPAERLDEIRREKLDKLLDIASVG